MGRIYFPFTHLFLQLCLRSSKPVVSTATFFYMFTARAVNAMGFFGVGHVELAVQYGRTYEISCQKPDIVKSSCLLSRDLMAVSLIPPD